MKNYKELLDNFLVYYQQKCSQYLDHYQGTFEADYFKKWYEEKGIPTVTEVQRKVDFTKVDERLEGFIALYRHYIDMAWEQNEQELILENLFAVSERIQQEFSMFGYLQEQAAALETIWYDDSMSMEWNPHLKDFGKELFSYYLESDLTNQALFFTI